MIRNRLSEFILLITVFLIMSSCSLFFTTYDLSVISDTETFGSIVTDPDRTSFLSGTVVTLTAIPEEGCVFESWSGVDSSNDDTVVASVIMDSHRQVTAVFKPELELYNKYDSINETLSTDFAPAENDSWTFMIYLDGDNNLDAYADVDFEEMKDGASTAGNDYLKIIVLKDGDGDSDSKYYEIDATGAQEITDPGELNMGDPQTLEDFIDYTLTNYSADHYALILWNHGGGARSIEQEESTRQICIDETSSNDSLFLDEVQQAITAGFDNSVESLDFVGIDACVMGTIETAYELRSLTDYFVASMASVSYDGWDYSELFGRMTSAINSSSAEDLCRLSVKAYADSTSTLTEQSLSAVRTSELVDLKSSVDQLATALYSADQQEVIEIMRDSSKHFYDYDYDAEAISMPYHDLNDFCNIVYRNRDYLTDDAGQKALAVIESLGECIVSAYAGSYYGGYYGSGASVKRGLSIFFSNGDRLYSGNSHYSYQYWYTDYDLSSTDYWSELQYGRIDFCTSDEDEKVESWREMMEAWYDPYRPPVGWTPGAW